MLEVGSRIRDLREARAWTQQQLALNIPLSQKQMSRIENGEVHQLSREIVIRLGTLLEEPIITGEVNQWLHHLDYRPLMEPHLPLPNSASELARHFSPYPAALLDIGWFVRDWNWAMQKLFDRTPDQLIGMERNLLVQIFHPRSRLMGYLSPDVVKDLLHRLVWDWTPHQDEPWQRDLAWKISQRLGHQWWSFLRNLPQSSSGVAPLSEVIRIPATRHGTALAFRSYSVPVCNRPDLRVTVYYPLTLETLGWCQHVQGGSTP